MLYVMNLETVKKYKKIDKTGTNWISLSVDVPNLDNYLNNWNQIKDFLKMEIDTI